MNELPDYLPGYLEAGEYLIFQHQAEEFYQGVDIIIPSELKERDKVVSYNSYSGLKVYMKDDLNTPFVSWQGSINNGLTPINGVLTITIPIEVAKRFQPNIYYLAIIGTSKINPIHSAVLFTKTISIIQSAVSSIPTPVIEPEVSEKVRGGVTEIAYNF